MHAGSRTPRRLPHDEGKERKKRACHLQAHHAGEPGERCKERTARLLSGLLLHGARLGQAINETLCCFWQVGM